MSLIVSYGSWLTLTVFPVSWSNYMSLIVAGCLSWSLLVPWSYCMSHTVSNSSKEFLHVLHCLL